MISTRKKIAYGVMLVTASGLFANELVNATRSEPSFTPVERAAEAGSDSRAMLEEDEQAPSFQDPASQALASESAQPAQVQPELGAVLASLEAALDRLDSAPAGADGRRVDALVRQQRPNLAPEPTPEAFVTAPSSVAPSSTAPSPLFFAAPPAVDDTVARRREDSERRARLQRFLEESPLSGVVCGGESGAALFGGRIVRMGENLLGDEGLVKACTPQGVGVLLAGREAWIPMPAVRVRPAASSAGSANAGAAPSAASAVPAANLPNVSPSTARSDTPNAPRADAPSQSASGAANRAGAARTGGQQ